MFRPLTRLLLFLAPACLLTPLSAQIHEAEPPVDLTRALVFQADSAAKDTPLGTPDTTQVGQKSFAVALQTTFPTPLVETELAGQTDKEQGWRFLVTADGTLRFEALTKGKADPSIVSTLPGAITPGAQHHLLINILRDAAKPNASIWVDGVELTSGVIPAVNLSSPEPLRTVTARQVYLFHRDILRPEVLALKLKASGEDVPAASVVSGKGKFVLKPGTTIAFIGGSEAVVMAESGELEAMLLGTQPGAKFHFRCLAWEGDTVFRQDRPMNFGDLPQQLARTKANTAVVMFGRQECLEHGPAGVPEYKKHLDALLTQIATQTPDIIVIGPVPFEKKAAPFPDLTGKNSSLEKDYNSATEDVAKKHGAIFANVIQHWPKSPQAPLTTDGVTLTDAGMRTLARAIGDSLSLSQLSPSDLAASPLLSSLQAKNGVWHAYWRPANWAFLHGDRTQQPSSRDPDNPQLRFFPSEQEKYLPLLKEAEDQVFKLADELAAKKLP